MKEMYGLLGKKNLFLLLAYQLIFLVSLLTGSAYFFTKPIHDSQFSGLYNATAIIIIYSSLMFLIHYLWEILSSSILRLDYTRFRMIHHRVVKPISIVFLLSSIMISYKASIFYNLQDIIYKIGMYSFFASLVLLTLVNLAFFIVVTKDILLSNRLYQKDTTVFPFLIHKYGEKAVDRILLSLNLVYGKVKGNPLPSHNGFSFVGLSSYPLHNTKNYSWANTLEKNYKEIKEEALKLIQKHHLQSHYLNRSDIVSGQWNSIMLIQGGKKEPICQQCPKTMALLQLISNTFSFREVMFSVLEPGAIIKPHRDYSNTYLTYHLGLVIPNDCGIIVGGIESRWEEGKSLILDTSYEHEVWNNSNDFRLILLVDFFHPDLTEAEKEFLISPRS